MKLFRKTLSIFLLLALVFSLVACGKTPDAIPQIEQEVLVDTTGMTDLQKAVVITAESYFLRGARAQYDQYNLTSKSSGGIQNVGRRLTGVKAPEDYTTQNNGYTDCSGFVYDLYLFALGMPITTGERNTKAFCTSSPHTILCEYPEKDNFSQLTEEELAAKEKAFTETLQPGDIIVYRNAGNSSGHAMVYVGNGMMIHSTGSTYDFSAAKDKYESSGTYRYESIESTLLAKGNRRYLFNKYIYIIMRPLNQFADEIPYETQQRMNLMRGMIAEKLSSHTYGQTASPGDTIHYTIKIKNNSSVDKTLTITDTLSEYTTYVSGADNESKGVLTWTVTVPVGETVEIPYSVKVKDSAPLGEYIVSSTDVSGVSVNCQRFKIAKTLSEDEQSAIADKLEELKDSGLSPIEMVNAVYEQTTGKAVFTQDTTDAIWEELVTLKTRDYILNTEGALYTMIAPSLYGGRNLCELSATTLMAQERTRLLIASLLVPGDIVLADDNLYLYTGDVMMLTDSEPISVGATALTAMLANKKFVVLRPSMVF